MQARHLLRAVAIGSAAAAELAVVVRAPAGHRAVDEARARRAVADHDLGDAAQPANRGRVEA